MKLFRMTQNLIALESDDEPRLEIEKLVIDNIQPTDPPPAVTHDENQDAVDSTSQSSDSQPEPAESAAQAEPLGQTKPGERVSGDTDVPDTESPEEPKPSEKKEDNDADGIDNEVSDDKEDQDISTESLRQMLSLESSHIAKYNALSLEMFDNGDYSAVKNSARWLGELGVNLATNVFPKVMSAVYKGTVYAFGRLGYIFRVGFTALEQYLRRRSLSFDRLEKKMDKALETLDNLDKSSQRHKNQYYKDDRSVRQMVIGDSTDLIKHIDVLVGFVDSAINELGSSIKRDINSIEELITYSMVPSKDHVEKMMEVNVSIKGLTAGEIDGFAKESHLVQGFYVNTPLPGNAVLIGHFPTNQVKTREDWNEAYRLSDLFIGVNRQSFKTVNDIPYLDVSQLRILLTKLGALNALCVKHQAFYENMRKQKIHQKLVYKNYFDNIVRRGKKVDIKETMVDLVILRNSFIDKVYLPAAIDIHDYCVRVISVHLRFISSNLLIHQKS